MEGVQQYICIQFHKKLLNYIFVTETGNGQVHIVSQGRNHLLLRLVSVGNEKSFKLAGDSYAVALIIVW